MNIDVNIEWNNVKLRAIAYIRKENYPDGKLILQNLYYKDTNGNFADVLDMINTLKLDISNIEDLINKERGKTKR
jgi:hypothetical protein